MKTKRIIVAGPLVKVSLSPRGTAHDGPKARAAKRRLSSEAQRRMNAKYRKEKLELAIACNFRPRDHFVLLTFRDEDLPADEKGVNAKMKEFLRQHNRRVKGPRPVVIWRAEHRHEADDFRSDRRWHVHALIQARSGEDYALLAACWPWGWIDVEPVRIDKDHSYAALAAYLTKEPTDRAGTHAWHQSRNAARPEVESFPVPDDKTLQAPKGAVTLEEARERNEYGAMEYLKYLEPGGLRDRKRPKPKRRR